MYAIAAVDQHWGIGRDNALLFHISADMKRFRALTEGKTVLMGRKTLQSLPGGRGLPHRRNIVLTGDRDFTAENAEIVHFPVEAVFQAGKASTAGFCPCATGCISPRSLPTVTPTPFSPIWTPTPSGRRTVRARSWRRTA